MRWWHLLFPLALAGCSGSMLARCQSAGATYAAIQPAIEAAVTGDITPEAKAELQRIDRVAVTALGVCEAAATAGDKDAALEAATLVAAQALLAGDLTRHP